MFSSEINSGQADLIAEGSSEFQPPVDLPPPVSTKIISRHWQPLEISTQARLSTTDPMHHHRGLGALLGMLGLLFGMDLDFPNLMSSAQAATAHVNLPTDILRPPEREFIDQVAAQYRQSYFYKNDALGRQELARLLAEVQIGESRVGVVADHIFHAQVRDFIEKMGSHVVKVQRIGVSRLREDLAQDFGLESLQAFGLAFHRKNFEALPLEEQLPKKYAFFLKYRAEHSDFSSAVGIIGRDYDSQGERLMVDVVNAYLELFQRNDGLVDQVDRVLRDFEHPELLLGYEITIDKSGEGISDPLMRQSFYSGITSFLTLSSDLLSLPMDHRSNQRHIIRLYPPRVLESLLSGYQVGYEYVVGETTQAKIIRAGGQNLRVIGVMLAPEIYLGDVEARIHALAYLFHDLFHAIVLAKHTLESRRILYQVLPRILDGLDPEIRRIADIDAKIGDADSVDSILLWLTRVLTEGVSPRELEEYVHTLRARLQQDAAAYERLRESLDTVEDGIKKNAVQIFRKEVRRIFGDLEPLRNFLNSFPEHSNIAILLEEGIIRNSQALSRILKSDDLEGLFKRMALFSRDHPQFNLSGALWNLGRKLFGPEKSDAWVRGVLPEENY